MGLYPRRRQHRTAHTQIFNSYSTLLNGRFRFLQWNQSHAFKARAPLHVSLMQPVIVSTRDIDGPVAADDFAESEAQSGVKHRGLNPNVFQESDPTVGADFIESTRRKIVQVRRMQVIEGWKWIEERVGVVFFPVGSGHEFHNGLGIFNNMSVAINDGMALERHNWILLFIHMAPSPSALSRRGQQVKKLALAYSTRMHGHRTI